MSRKPQKGYFVKGHFVAEGSELDLQLKAELKGTTGATKTDLKREMEALQALKKIYHADPRRFMLIGIMEEATEVKLRDCSPVRQLELRHQLSANEAKQKAIESALKELDQLMGREQKL